MNRISYVFLLSQVIDPWGAVIAQCSDGVDVCFAEINLNMIKKIRDEMPIMRHRRPDLYGFLQSYNKGCTHFNSYKNFHLYLPVYEYVFEMMNNYWYLI